MKVNILLIDESKIITEETSLNTLDGLFTYSNGIDKDFLFFNLSDGVWRRSEIKAVTIPPDDR